MYKSEPVFINKVCIYCAKKFATTTECMPEGSSGICKTCDDKINRSNDPSQSRRLLEFEAFFADIKVIQMR